MDGPEVWPRDSRSYLRCVATVGFFTVFQCGHLVTKLLRDGGIQAAGFPTTIQPGGQPANHSRPSRWSRTKQTTLVQGSLAVLCGIATIAGAGVSMWACTLHTNPFY